MSSYPILLQNDVQIVRETHGGGYLIKYKENDGAYGIIWLPDELANPCPTNPKCHEAIVVAKKYLLIVLVDK